MPRYAPRHNPKRDANEKEIVHALQAIGATVMRMHTDQGHDLMVGFRGVTWHLEVKDGSKPPSARKLTPGEQAFMEKWRGTKLQVVCSVSEAIKAIGAEVG